MRNILLFIILNHTLSNIYTPYKNQINSIFGTGDTDIDISYKQKCKEICLNCCTGELTNITCATSTLCNDLQAQLDFYLLTIIISVYFSIIVFTMIILFIVFYFLSLKVYDKATSYKNGAVAAILTLFYGLVIPIVILKLIAVFKGRSMSSLLGGDFKRISNNLVSVRIKLTERQKKYIIEDEELSEKRNVKLPSSKELTTMHMER
jgi:heme/copper-type cytochrome/quinol oxidase subunit 2